MKKDAPFRATLSGAADSPVLSVTGAWASVTIVGSRIIYPSTVASVDVQLKITMTFLYRTNWFDNGDLHIGPENASGIPFYLYAASISNPTEIRADCPRCL